MSAPKLAVVQNKPAKKSREEKNRTYWFDIHHVLSKGDLYWKITRFLERVDRKPKLTYSKTEVVDLLRELRDNLLQ